LLAGSIPKERAGVYMGIFNMFIVVPQIINMISVPFFYKSLLGNDPTHALVLAGFCLCVAGFVSYRLKIGRVTEG
jgi:maltose/moltooligosaccharide transporter